MKNRTPAPEQQEPQLTFALETPKINAEIGLRIQGLPANTRRISEHLLLAGGKRLRPLLTLLIGRAFGCFEQKLYTLGAAIEMLHTATLLHDDILDNADMRRSRAAAHLLFGTSQTLLAGDALLAKSLLLVSSFGDTRFTDCVSEAVMRTAEGEIAELACLRNISISHADYVEIITGKTAWMLRAACELGALLAKANESQLQAAARFGLELGIAFQIVDDALDFYPARAGAGTGKPRGGDLREGKITPPLLFYMAALSRQEAESFRRRFENGDFSNADIERICDEIHGQDHAGRARKLAEEHLEKAGAALESFPPSQEKLVLQQMAYYILTREQ
ncbi:MAG: polyprenyl synthetase family protein [Desulfovibrio sp.]|jgi:octaprenyl-diphosphate synthase|nr:polyprenyl synthetase family protein [Desulfovibrio sp.]